MAHKKLYIETHGCQMNVDDSARMEHLLKPLGYGFTPFANEADLILINTCSIREKASHKAHSAIGKYYPVKEENPRAILGLTGCQAQVEGKELLNRFHYLDFVLGPDQVGSLPDLIRNLEAGQTKRLNHTARIKPADFHFVDLIPQQEESLTTAFVTIMKGCDNFCSFCIVPFVRGREVSRSSLEIVQEIQRLTEHGVKEITLLGQNVNSYGTKGKEISFAKLLFKIAEETSVKRIRFTTSHPKDVKEDLALAFRDIPTLAKHIHLPVQSGSNTILQKMYRTYTREDYLRIVDQLRNACPEIAISTDIIVGFPGETDQDFEETLSLVDEVAFDASFSFYYSPRPYTTAGRYLKDDVPLEVKANRLEILQEKQKELSLKNHQACLGKVYEVLVEGPSKIGNSYQGRNTHNQIVHFPAENDAWIGELVRVKINQAGPNALRGEMEN